MAKDRLGTLLTYASMLVLALGFSGPAALLGAYSQAPGSPAACLVTLPLLLLPLTRRAQAAWKRGVGAMLLGLAGAALVVVDIRSLPRCMRRLSDGVSALLHRYLDRL